MKLIAGIYIFILYLLQMTSCVQMILQSRALCPVGRFVLKPSLLQSYTRIQCKNAQQCISTPAPLPPPTSPTTVTAVTDHDSENLVIPDYVTDTRVIALMKAAFDIGIETYEIEEHVTKKPELLRATPDQWVRILKQLLHHGFDGPIAVAMISKCPSLLKMDEEKLTKGILVWMSCQFGEQLMLELLSTYPELIGIPQKTVLTSVRFLAAFMESRPRVGKMLLIAPNIITQEWRELKEKLEYLNNLHVDKSEIASSGVLRLSLHDIKARHEFLMRAGLYKIPKKKQTKRSIKNPGLNEIVNSSKIEFANKLGGMSLTEFEVFSEMYKEELKDNGELDSDYESDEEDEK